MSDLLELLRDAEDPQLNQVFMFTKMFGSLFEQDDDDSIPPKVKSLRNEATVRATRMAEAYKKHGFDFHKLVAPFLEKKLKYINQATSKKEIDKIFSPQVPRYDGTRLVTDHPYPILEEELMYWSHLSMERIPHQIAVERFKELTLEIFGFDANEFLQRKDALP